MEIGAVDMSPRLNLVTRIKHDLDVTFLYTKLLVTKKVQNRWFQS